MRDWIPLIVGAPILIFFAAAVIAFIFGMIIEGIPWGGLFRIGMFFIVAYVAYDFFIGYEQPIIKLF